MELATAGSHAGRLANVAAGSSVTPVASTTMAVTAFSAV